MRHCTSRSAVWHNECQPGAAICNLVTLWESPAVRSMRPASLLFKGWLHSVFLACTCQLSCPVAPLYGFVNCLSICCSSSGVNTAWAATLDCPVLYVAQKPHSTCHAATHVPIAVKAGPDQATGQILSTLPCMDSSTLLATSQRRLRG